MLQTDIIKVRKITLIKIILFSQIYKFIYNKTKSDPMLKSMDLENPQFSNFNITLNF